MAVTETTSRQELEYLIRARYGLIYVVSSEEERVEEAICGIGQARQRKVIAWSITEGFTSLDGGSNFSDVKDPLRALDFIANFEDDVICVSGELGASEVDMVINTGRVMTGDWKFVEEDIRAVCETAHSCNAKL